jgi:anti-sigma factor RsiW
MTCRQVQDALGDYVDGTLAGDARRDVESHLRQCPACAVLADDLARIRQLAASLERLQPPLGAWARIAREARLPGRFERRPPAWKLWVPVAAAASVILAVALAYVLVRRPAAPPAATTASAPAGSRSDRPELQTVATELQLADQHYENAIAALEKLANDRQVLDPDVAAKLQQNFQVIDTAIAESRAALKTEPTSQQAQQSLFEAFRTKIALLQDTIALINEMRKGNQEGTARIAEGLNKS